MSDFAIDPEDEAASLVGLLDRLLDTGVHVAGDLVIGLADVELIRVALRLLVASEETAARTGIDAPTRPDGPGEVGRAAPPSVSGPPVGGAGRGAAHDEGRTATSGPPPAPAAGGDVPAERPRPAQPARSDDEALADGVARLVLTVVAVVHDLVERQAVRRVEAGTLDDDQVERLGVALEALEDRMARVREALGVTDEDLNLDLGPLGRLR